MSEYNTFEQNTNNLNNLNTTKNILILNASMDNNSNNE